MCVLSAVTIPTTESLEIYQASPLQASLPWFLSACPEQEDSSWMSEHLAEEAARQ